MRPRALYTGRTYCRLGGPLVRLVIMGGLIVAVGSAVRPCQAQRQRSVRPSETGPTNQLERNFGRVGGWLSGGGGMSTARRTPATRNPELSNPMRQRRDPRFYRRPGLGQAGMDLGYGVGTAPIGSLMPPHYRPDPLKFSASPPTRPRPVMGALSRAYMTTYDSQKLMVDQLAWRSPLVSTDYLSWTPLEGGRFSSAPEFEPQVAGLADPKTSTELVSDPQRPKQTLEELISNHVTALRRSYVARGWQAFGDGEYLAAMRMFSLAENASVDSPEERASVRMALVYVSIAASQLSQAANHLEWLIADTSAGRGTGHPDAFNRIFDENGISTIGDLYVGSDGVSHMSDYQAHNQAVGSAASRNPDSSQALALSAAVEWGRGRRANAIFIAQRIADPASRLSRLASVLEEAERLYQLRRPAAPRTDSLSESAAPLLKPPLQPRE